MTQEIRASAYTIGTEEHRAQSIVLIGGGTGAPQLLVALRKAIPNASFSIVVPVTDTGRSTGVVRRTFGIPGPGDLRHCLTALADDNSAWPAVLERRLSATNGSDLDGMAVGNLVLAALIQETGNIGNAAKAVARMLGVQEQVLPVSIGDLHLEATLADGTRVSSELEVRHPGKESIVALHIEGTHVSVWEPTRVAISTADVIVIGPGSLWTSIGGVLAVPGVREAIGPDTNVIFVCNTTTQPGQTDNFDAEKHVSTLIELLNRPPRTILMNRQRLSSAEEEELAADGLRLIVLDHAAEERLKRRGLNVLSDDFLSARLESPGLWQKLHTAYHDMDKVAMAIAAIV